MKLNLFNAALMSLATGSYAWEPRGHEYRAPLPGASRSPCPGLNALANHGYLPRSGENIDLKTFQNAISGGYNFEPNSMDFVFELAVNFNLTTTGNPNTWNLFDLARHDEIEIDGSLSRNDIYFGDDVHFDHNVWAQTAKHLGLNDNRGPAKNRYITIEVAAKARAARVAEAMRVNPSFNNSANAMSGSPGTTALYLLTMWDYKVGAAPKAWVKPFFEEERIPYREGYRKPEVPLLFKDVEDMTQKVVAVKV
ncbi:Chloroperoxidase [Penicillium bovifimosum]|uniref:Chloroperoxidase n=1 Tax=Penicillium bovifimosum TaxID=126998 RepID=A0A9W9GJJ8_9EURO|nr:Chloroperoxidase [Penicillium bovifimosum]KAJ5120897.1 Chloroperoxidase [Penicillium bovifimosum]